MTVKMLGSYTKWDAPPGCRPGSHRLPDTIFPPGSEREEMELPRFSKEQNVFVSIRGDSVSVAPAL